MREIESNSSPTSQPGPRKMRQSIKLKNESLFIVGLKWCSGCAKELPFANFSKNSRRQSGLNTYCRQCISAYHKPRYDPKARKKKQILADYGLSYDHYLKILESQNGKCAICQSPIQPFGTPIKSKMDGACVDHCHKTGKVRGLLFRNCNTGLGAFKDDKRIMRKAIRYLSP